MKRRDGSLVALVLMCAFGGPQDLAACSCGRGSGPPCEEAWLADVVVDATVRSIVEIDHDAFGQPRPSQQITVEVHQGFLNASAGRLEMVTPGWGPSCGFGFVEGRRYLVYASKAPTGKLSVTRCSRTRPIEQAQDDLRYLTNLPAAGAGARVFGRVRHWQRDPFEAEGVDYGPLEGLSVNVKGAGFSVDATTDVNGRFEIGGLPVGQATLSVVAPYGFDSRYLQRDLDFRDSRACSQRDFQLRYTAGAFGTVVDKTGRALVGVRVDAVAAELAGHRPPPYQGPAITDEQGAFEFGDLPPGDYVFGVNLTVPRARQTAHTTPVFLPGVQAAAEATVFALKPGDRITVGVIRLEDR